MNDTEKQDANDDQGSCGQLIVCECGTVHESDGDVCVKCGRHLPV